MTREEAAAHMRCSTRTVDRLIESKELPARKFGRRVRIRRADVDAYMESLPLVAGR